LEPLLLQAEKGAGAQEPDNEPLRFFVNDASSPIQREIYDQTYEAGLRARFEP
jgi:hypothetical protein